MPKIAQELNAMAQSLADAQMMTQTTPPEPGPSSIAAATNIPFEIQGQVAPKTVAKKAAVKPEMPDFVKAMLADEKEAAPKAKVQARREAPQPHIEIGVDNQAKIVLPSGSMNISELTAILQVLPLDLTFVDQNDIVRWFSDNEHRIFPRTRVVIGRAVVNCHPPKSVDKVEKILADFHAGREDHADFWLNFRGIFVYIRYFAVRDPQGQYLGCLEVSQDLTELRALTGEKRL
ncbi:Hemerythrin HHE cation binding domain protein (fragment) [Latilactobacillus curvatus]